MKLLSPIKSAHSRTTARRRATALALSTVVAGTAAAALATPASAVTPAAATVLGGFPASYSDGTSTFVPCVDGSLHCGGTTAADVTAPDGEFFYNLVEGQVPVKTGGFVKVVIGLEGAFDPDTGQPTVFHRVRFVGRDLVPGKYTIVHPYGTAEFTTDGRGRGRSSVDTDCLTAGCGPTTFLTGALVGNYKDNGGVEGSITGGINGVNSVTVKQGANQVGFLNKFTVQAKVG